MFFRLVKQLTEKEGMTKELKSTDQMAWIGAINDIQARAGEIVYTDIIPFGGGMGILIPLSFPPAQLFFHKSVV